MSQPNDAPPRGSPEPVAGLPVMRLVQSPRYQALIDRVEDEGAARDGFLAPPEKPLPSDNILVVTSMKNEAPFILEWIAYHMAIGVTHFLVYTNDCTDPTNDILDRLADLGHVTRIDNPWKRDSGEKPQHAALKDAVTQKVYARADWVLTIDVDEFLNIHVGDGTIQDFLAATNWPNVVSFTWKFFGNKGIHDYVDRPIIEQFVHCAPEFIRKPRLGWGFKSMFHTSSPYRKIGVHRPLNPHKHRLDEVRWVNGSGRVMPRTNLLRGWRSTTESLGYRLATLNHYVLRSADSYLVKRERGRINHTDQDQGVYYWTRRNYATECDDRIHARLPAMTAVLDRLIADRPLAALHEKAVAWHRDRVACLRADPDYEALYQVLIRDDRPDALYVAKLGGTPPKVPGLEDAPDCPPGAAAEGGDDRFRDAAALAATRGGFFWEGAENAVCFVPGSDRLVVSFDDHRIVKTDGQRLPADMEVLSGELGWSVLGVMAKQRNWFRHDFVHDTMEHLATTGFFRRFPDVLLMGASMGGFAALVYSGLVPGARVLAIAPQSTLDRTKVPEDERWGWTARRDWSGRYGDAKVATSGARSVTVLADLHAPLERLHVSRLDPGNLTVIGAPFMGGSVLTHLRALGAVAPVVRHAADGTLTAALFHPLIRGRHDLPRYHADLALAAETRGRPDLARRVAAVALRRGSNRRIEEMMGRMGGEAAE